MPEHNVSMEKPMKPEPMRKVLLIGIGAAGTTHLKALERIPSVTVIAVVDTDTSRSATFRDKEIPIYHSSADASQHHPDIVVIATPTPTHARICSDVAKYFPTATVLVEKPAADNLPDAQILLSGTAGAPPVNVAFHMAFAPEVNWAVNVVAARKSSFGAPISVQSWSGDPHQSDLVSAESTLSTSWIDSGINALSVIDRFAKVVSRASLRRLGKPSWSTFEGIFICEFGINQLEAVVLTSWNVTGRARSTRIRYSSGAEVVMNHHAVAGYVVEDGRITEMFGTDGSIPRRTSHYRQLYQSWLVNNHPISSPEAALRLHTLLLSSIDDI